MITIPHPYPEGEAERYVSRQLREFKQSQSVTFAISLESESLVIGVAEVRDIDWEHSQAELSFWLAVEAWGNGYTSEALEAILHYSFEELQINRLYAYHLVRNPASGRVLEKNRFKREGLLRQRVRKWNVFEDVVLQAMLRSEWERARGEPRIKV